MVKVSRSGKMVPSMWVNGAKTKLMVKVNSYTLTAMSMRVTGLMIKPMASEPISMLMALCIKVSGETTYSMVMALRHGPIIPSTRAITNMDASTALELTIGMMGVCTQETGSKTKLVGWVFTHG